MEDSLNLSSDDNSTSSDISSAMADGAFISEADQGLIDEAQLEKHHREEILGGYFLSKWTMTHVLKEEIASIKLKMSTLEELVVMADEGNRADLISSKSVNDYWETSLGGDHVKNAYTDRKCIQAAMIIQCIARFWSKLKKMREGVKFKGFNVESKVTAVQIAVRKFHAIRQVRRQEAKLLMGRDLFSDFCTSMVAGVPIRMFSRKHGTIERRVLKFSKDHKSVTYVTNLYAPKRSFEIKHIFKVSKHLSSNVYPKAHVKHKNWCFHIHLLGPHDGRLLDFEPLNHSDSKLLYDGFVRLAKMASSQSPFYIDQMGVPSRAVGSIVRYALKEGTVGAISESHRHKNKGCTTEADLMRFRAAVRGLSMEYASWAKKKAEEESMYLLQLRENVLTMEDDTAGLANSDAKTRQEKLKEKKTQNISWNMSLGTGESNYSSEEEDLLADDWSGTEVQSERIYPSSKKVVVSESMPVKNDKNIESTNTATFQLQETPKVSFGSQSSVSSASASVSSIRDVLYARRAAEIASSQNFRKNNVR